MNEHKLNPDGKNEEQELDLNELLMTIQSSSIDEVQKILDEQIKIKIPELSFSTQTPIWLSSDFQDNSWVYIFQKQKFQIDFNIPLDDQSSLTSTKNSKLLNTIKIWLCHQTAPKFNGGSELKVETAKSKIHRCLHIIDKILLNGKNFQLGKFGLSLITQDALISMISDIANLGVPEGVYNYQKTLTHFLKTKCKEINQIDIQRATVKFPLILEVDSVRSLDLTENEIIKSRTWLLKEGYYSYPKSKSNPGVYNTKKLLQKIFPKVLYIHNAKFPVFKELRIASQAELTEFPRVPTRQTIDKSHKTIEYAKTYLSTLNSLQSLPKKSCYVVIDSQIQCVNLSQILNNNISKSTKQYRSLPASCLISSINKSCDFIESHSLLIKDFVTEIITDEKVQKAILDKKDVQEKINHIVVEMIPNNLKGLGVNCWSLKDIGRRGSPNYHFRLRNNEGIRDLFQVLISSYQYIISILLARRNQELSNLRSNCLSPNKNPNLPENRNTEYSVIFNNGKSGDAFEREVIKRPIVWYGAKLIWDLQDFFKNISNLTQTEEPEFLFNNIGIVGGIIRGNFNQNLDVFCDYFETTTVRINDTEHRFYYREHQLRRFFAKIFFHSGAFGGIECLRWFLAHSDIEHVYRYISDSIPGSVLNEIKAETLVHSLNLKTIKNIDVIRKKILKRYKSDSIQLTTIEEAISELTIADNSGFATISPHLDSIKRNLKNNLLEMLNNGSINLYPEFFKVQIHNSEEEINFRLLLHVKEIE